MIIIRSFPLISSGLSHHCVGEALQGPCFTHRQAEVTPLLQVFLAGGGICFPQVRSLTGHRLMPAWMPGLTP